jgi:radical SAM protein with 4Fe4S-binding SPASM domain
MSQYRYNSSDPLRVKLEDVSDRERYLLTESKTFCIYPWIHLHAYPTGEAYPCCHAEMGVGVVGNCREKTLEEIWQDRPMQTLRENMLADKTSETCRRCYEQEAAGFFSGRRSANKHHGHHIHKIEQVPFELTYWDVRFSNLCNLKCRSCGHIFSSQWFQDQVKLAGPEYSKRNPVLNIAGRTEDDMWQQLLPHIDHVEQIYFAGGEPLLMHEHYNILEELARRGLFHVRLIYNTNFTHTQLKDRSVFDYWRLFDSVSVGASLDGSEDYAEYIRKGCDWDQIEQNRINMLKICPQVDFYVSATLSIMNALHLPDFHRNWVERGFIRHQDFNINILQDPDYLRIDIAGTDYKKEITEKFLQHIEWLQPHDRLQRATTGYQSAINFLQAKDNSGLQSKFWSKTKQLDQIRGEDICRVIPELMRLHNAIAT